MQESFRVNVLGNVHLLAEFVPLIKKGSLKKVVVISSAMGDIPMVVDTNMTISSEYSIAKIALNMAVAKFHVQYKSEGILAMAVSPGLVATRPQPDRKSTLWHPRILWRIRSHPPPYDPHELGCRADRRAFSIDLTPDIAEGVQSLMTAITQYEPNFAGPLTPEKSVEMVLEVVEAATIEKNGGKMVSHFVDRPDRWL